MKRLIYIFIIFISICSCETDKGKTVEGDLYFKLIDFQRFFDSPDSVLVKIENSARTVNKDTLNEQDRKIYNLVQFMVDNNLLRKPFIRLRLESGEIKILFLDTSDYRQFKQYDRGDLLRNDKKVRIKVNVTEVKYNSLTAFNTVKILSIGKIDGKTYWSK